MSNKEIISLYEDVCNKNRFDILTSGRYLLNSFNYKKKLAKDILQKLELNAEDLVLDLGCNVGIYHPYLHRHIRYMLGVDASPAIILKAVNKHQFNNVEYLIFDITKDWPALTQKFSKVLLYSVIHFLNNIDDVEMLINKIQANMPPHGKIMLGEVRTKEKYDRFIQKQQKKKYKNMRDHLFAINKLLHKALLGEIKGHPCTSYATEEIIKVGEKYGFKVTELEQQKFHPFYNTCSDFIFAR